MGCFRATISRQISTQITGTIYDFDIHAWRSIKPAAMFLLTIFVDFRGFGLTIEQKYIKNNAWVTVNNDFWVTSEAICQ